jgi:hypothetical protein
MDRRTLMGMVVASIFGASLRTGALPVQKIWRVGIIGTTPTTTPESTRIWDTFRQELQDRGYIEGAIPKEKSSGFRRWPPNSFGSMSTSSSS